MVSGIGPMLVESGRLTTAQCLRAAAFFLGAAARFLAAGAGRFLPGAPFAAAAFFLAATLAARAGFSRAGFSGSMASMSGGPAMSIATGAPWLARRWPRA